MTHLETLVDALQNCRLRKDRARAKQLHSFLSKHHLDTDKVLGNFLVPLLVACGLLQDAQNVFDKLLHPNDHSCCSLICAYVASTEPHHAFSVYDRMHDSCVCPSRYTYLHLFRACAAVKETERGRLLHGSMIIMGLDSDIFLCNSVIHMYVKCTFLEDAHNVFGSLASSDVISWNALVAACVEEGLVKGAHSYLDQMQREGISPSAVTFLCSLTACGIEGTSDSVHKMHTEILKRGFEPEDYVGSALVDAYAKCNKLADAHTIFDKLTSQDLPALAALISGYAEQGKSAEVHICIEKLLSDANPIDSIVLVRCLKACSIIGALGLGRKLHIEVKKSGLERDIIVGNTLVDMYAKCGSLLEAAEAFHQLPNHDQVSWNVLIAGYLEHGEHEEAMCCFDQMQAEGVPLDNATLVGSLKACGSTSNIQRGQILCTEIVKVGMERDLLMGSMIVDCYAKCGSLAEAELFFNHLPHKNAVTWTVLICGYSENGLVKEALNCFDQMQANNIVPLSSTFISILKSCILEDIHTCRHLHSEITKRAFERDLSLSNALLDIYCKCGSPEDGLDIFSKLPTRDIVSCTAITYGSDTEFKDNALVSPNNYLFVARLNACASVSNGGDGQSIHNEVITTGLDADVFVGNALVDMYMKCSFFPEAHHVFSKLPIRNAVSWNALIAGCVEHELVKETLSCFKQMQLEKVPPVGVTFSCILKACGLLGSRDIC